MKTPRCDRGVFLILQRRYFFIKRFHIFFEEILREVVDGVGDKKRGEDVNGVVEMSHEDDHSEKDGGQSEENEKPHILFENKRH